MFYSSYILLFYIIIHHFFMHISKAITSGEDKMLITFVRNDHKMQISEYSKQKYGAYLGIVYFIRKNWQCDKISEELEEYKRTEYQKNRRYLDILYEYLSREYAGFPTVKPIFFIKNRIEIEAPIIYAIYCLVRISQFCFKSKWGNFYEYKLNKFFNNDYEPKMLNEERLNYAFKLENEPKMPINEIILQLAIDTANECQTNERLDGIIRQNFDEFLRKMFKKAEGRVKNDDDRLRVAKINDDKHKIIVGSKFDDKWTWTEDALFSDYVKGFATNLEKFFKLAKEYSNFLGRKKEKQNILWDNDGFMISVGLYEIKKMKEYLTQKYEAHLGVIYLLRTNWHCEKIETKFEENERTQCQKHCKYLHILHEYLFRLYAEGKSDELFNRFPAVKPIFMRNNGNNQMELIDVVKSLSRISESYWGKLDIICDQLFLKNEVELNYEINEKEKPNEFEHNIREEFAQKMKKMYENTKDIAKEEKVKLDKAIENAAKDVKRRYVLRKKYNDKFGGFISAPFS